MARLLIARLLTERLLTERLLMARLLITLLGLELTSSLPWLATLAFLAVFKVLIKLFFWMDMVFNFSSSILFPGRRDTLVQAACQSFGISVEAKSG